jgi:hypothetical protein
MVDSATPHEKRVRRDHSPAYWIALFLIAMLSLSIVTWFILSLMVKGI